MNSIDLDDIEHEARRTVLVCWRDRNGMAHSVRKVVRFEKGLGPYVHWNKRAIPVDAMQTKLDVKEPGPAREA